MLHTWKSFGPGRSQHHTKFSEVHTRIIILLWARNVAIQIRKTSAKQVLSAHLYYVVLLSASCAHHLASLCADSLPLTSRRAMHSNKVRYTSAALSSLVFRVSTLPTMCWMQDLWALLPLQAERIWALSSMACIACEKRGDSEWSITLVFHQCYAATFCSWFLHPPTPWETKKEILWHWAAKSIQNSNIRLPWYGRDKVNNVLIRSSEKNYKVEKLVDRRLQKVKTTLTKTYAVPWERYQYCQILIVVNSSTGVTGARVLSLARSWLQSPLRMAFLWRLTRRFHGFV